MNELPWLIVTKAAPDPLAAVDIYFRCAICSERVGRQLGGRRGRIQTSKSRRVACGEHGRLQSPTMGEIRAEWTRLGKPAKFNLPLPPVQ
jgi:hypothetical protein